MTPDLSYYWEVAREWCGDNKWDDEKEMLQRTLLLPHTAPLSFSGIFCFVCVHSCIIDR